jgi:protein-tyrosine phosphatase
MQRHIAIEGLNNFRDLGGYETKSGKTIKWGQIFHSNTLASLTANEHAQLHQIYLE